MQKEMKEGRRVGHSGPSSSGKARVPLGKEKLCIKVEQARRPKVGEIYETLALARQGIFDRKIKQSYITCTCAHSHAHTNTLNTIL